MSTDPYQLTVSGKISTGPLHGTLVTATQPFSIKNVDPTILALMMKQPPAPYTPGSTPTAPFTSTGAVNEGAVPTDSGAALYRKS